MEKQKILFSAYSLDVGGIETALVNLLNYLDKTNKYEITLVLEKKQGVFLKEISSNVNIIQYSPSYNKILGKIINAFRRMNFIRKYKNKFQASFAYATYCKMASFTAQTASENSNLWVHSSYLEMFNKNKGKYKEFFNELNYNKFKNILFVSNKCKNEFQSVMGNTNTLVCKNIVDYNKIIKLSEEKVEFKKNEEFTFLYVGRITEKSKKISRLFTAANILKQQDYKFKIIVIGNGNEFDKYIKYVEENKLNEYVVFMGEKNNPYPYYKLADSLILVSEDEGYPVVYNEAQILNLPIITTDVSDSRLDIENKYGIVCKQDIEDIVNTMKKVIDKGIDNYILNKQQFDGESYNKQIYYEIDKIINNERKL